MSGQYQQLNAAASAPEDLAALPVHELFSPEAVAFVDALSTRLLHAPQARAYPEIMSLAYWMRRSNILRLKASLSRQFGGALLLPRGTVFHIAPSNVDTIFIYSWVSSLLMGNRNIVRVSTRSSPQTEVLLATLAELLDEPLHSAVGMRTLLTRYVPDDLVTTRLSAACDVRVIWGGDGTIAEIRRIPLPPTAVEVAFADKHSFALIAAHAWLEFDETQRSALARSFYNDAYWFDQLACSSPRQVFWLGDASTTAAARADFWPRIEQHLAERRERFGDADYVDKLVSADSLAIESAVRIESSPNNDLTRLWLETPSLHPEIHCGAGFFLESGIETLNELCPLLSRKVQTASYAGLSPETLRAFVTSSLPSGIDRFVPFGRALEFATTWDGFDLVRVFTREVTIA